MKASRLRGILFLVVWLVSGSAHAFYTSLEYASEEKGRRERLSFVLPADVDAPTLTLLSPRTLQITIPGIVSLPAHNVHPATTRYLEAMRIEEIPGGKLGLLLTVRLKKPYLHFRGNYTPGVEGKSDARYGLSIETYPDQSASGPTRLLEGRVLPGRDATLVVFSFTGSGWVNGLDDRPEGKGPPKQVGLSSSVDYGARTVRLIWPDASLDPNWRPVKPAGLAERVLPRGLSSRFLAYSFGKLVEMEIGFDKSVAEVHFHRSAEAGTFIIELRPAWSSDRGRNRSGPVVMDGRSDEARVIIQARKEARDRKKPLPLNRLTPVFINRPITVPVQDMNVDEGFFWASAMGAERDFKFGKARAYLDNLIHNFPDTPNREMVDLYRFDLATKMGWKSGWLLHELVATLEKHPNTHRYPELIALKLRLLNDALLFESSIGLMDDPNLPKNDPKVALERGRALMGISLMLPSKPRWREAENHLKRVFSLDPDNGAVSAKAHFQLAKLSSYKACGDQRDVPVTLWGRWRRPCDLDPATAILDSLIPEHLGLIANEPAWLLEMGDLYFKNRRFPQALRSYATLISNFPTFREVPWALLRAAESHRYMGETAEAKRLFERIKVDHPKSEATPWARIFAIQLDTEKPLDERLKTLDTLIERSALTDAVVEAHMTAATLRGEDGRFRETLANLNALLTLTQRSAVVERTNQLKLKYMVEGQNKALKEGRPEYALLLGEAHGGDWRSAPGHDEARLNLVEALMRLGSLDEANRTIDLLEQEPESEVRELGRALAMGTPLGLTSIARSIQGRVTPATARIRLAQAHRLADKSEWEGILMLLENLDSTLLNPEEKLERLRLMAKAESERGRFPQAVIHLEMMLYEQPIGDGRDYYWYATILNEWRGGGRALPVFRRVATEATEQEIQLMSRIRIGDILQLEGDLEGARAAYQEIVALNPDSPWAKIARENAAQLDLVQNMVN
ncbi:MAG: tetratricopeptide repeat protein [Magnetococcales bacterium]|nr:tetratricopeptide repeat protein [Magnetococcales bacterium]